MPLQEFLSMYQACHLESVPWLLWFGRACRLTPQPDRPWQGCVILLSGSRWTLGWCLGLFGRAGLVDMFLLSYQICHGRSSISGECSWLPLGSLLLCKTTLLALLAGGVVEFLTHTWLGTLYYSHRYEFLMLYLFPGSWTTWWIPRGLDIVFELILNVLLVWTFLLFCVQC